MRNSLLFFLMIGLISGVLTALSTPIIYGVSILVFCSLIPLILWSEEQKWTKLFVVAMGYSIGMNALGFFWVSTGLNSMWKIPYITGSLMASPLFLFSEFQIFFTLLFKNIIKRKFSNSLIVISLSAFAYAGFEFLFQTLFPDSLGLNFFYWPQLAQGLDLSGASLLSAVIWFTNESLLLAYKNKKTWFKYLIPVGLVYSSLWLYGSIKLNEYNQLVKQSKSVKALLIQPNLHHSERDTARTGEQAVVDKVLNTHYNMTLEGFKKHPDTEIIVWPETMYPFYYQSYSNLYQEQKEVELNNFLKDENLTLFFGAFGKTGEPIVIKNNMYGISHYNGKTETNRWEKTILFPFGEYIPMVKYFPWLTKIFKKSNTATPSENPTILPIGPENKTLNIGGSICYEILFSKLFWFQANKQSDLIINISNESFFGTFGEPELNLLHAASRAIETRTPILKNGNIGYSAGITASGQILSLADTDTVSTVFVDLPLVNHKDFKSNIYIQYGDWFSKLSLLLMGLSLIICFFKKSNQE